MTPAPGELSRGGGRAEGLPWPCAHPPQGWSPSDGGGSLGTALWAAGLSGLGWNCPLLCEDRGFGALPGLCGSRPVPGQAARALFCQGNMGVARGIQQPGPCNPTRKRPGACPRAGAAPVPVSGLSGPGTAKLGQCGGKSPFLWGLCPLGAGSDPPGSRATMFTVSLCLSFPTSPGQGVPGQGVCR